MNFEKLREEKTYACVLNCPEKKVDAFKKIHFHIFCTVPPNIDDALTSSDVIIREGDNVTLRCKAKGSPEPSIKWKRDDGLKIVISKTMEGEETNFSNEMIKK